jgi:hypothetical protein
VALEESVGDSSAEQTMIVGEFENRWGAVEVDVGEPQVGLTAQRLPGGEGLGEFWIVDAFDEEVDLTDVLELWNQDLLFWVQRVPETGYGRERHTPSLGHFLVLLNVGK